VWKLKDLVITDSSVNILHILPINLELLQQLDRDILVEDANIKFLEYINKLTENEFSKIDELKDFLDQHQTNISIFKQIKNIKLLPNIFQNYSSFNKYFTQFINSKKNYRPKDFSLELSFGFYVHTQFIRVQEHKYFCDKLFAEPIYDIEMPWFFFNYELGCSGIDDAILNSLQKDKFKWITKVPLPALKIFRDENRLDYMRGLLRKGVTDIKAKNDSDLIKVAEQLEINLREAFVQQESELKSLEREVELIVKKEIPITTGGALLGFIPYVGNLISLLSAGRDVKSMLADREKVKKEIKEKKDDFINLLMKSYKE
jgi:hypothetical protein